MNSNYEEIKIPKEIDEFIDLGIEIARIEIKNNKNRKKKLVVSFSVAFIICIVFLNFNKTLAYRIPLVGKVFRMVEKNAYYPNDYSKYATEVNKEVFYNGISITISEVVCDGRGIYVGYIVENEKPFKYPYINKDGYSEISQLLISQEYNKVDFLEEDLDISGFSGIQGDFIDDYTFVGFQRYKFKGEVEVPDNFIFKTKIYSVENFDKMQSRKKYINKGDWGFEIPVKTSRDLNKIINLDNQDIESDLVKINSIYLTEFETEINIEYKNNYYEEKQSDKVRFDLRVYNDENEEVYSTSADGVGNKFRYELESAGLDSKFIKVEIVEELYAPDENGYLILTNGERLGVIEEKIILSKVINIE